jgi:hypothetical protein
MVGGPGGKPGGLLPTLNTLTRVKRNPKIAATASKPGVRLNIFAE